MRDWLVAILASVALACSGAVNSFYIEKCFQEVVDSLEMRCGSNPDDLLEGFVNDIGTEYAACIQLQQDAMMVQLLVADDPALLRHLRSRAASYLNTTGANITLTPVSINQLHQELLATTVQGLSPSSSSLYDGWILPSYLVGDIVANKRAMDLREEQQQDQLLDWGGILPPLRDLTAVFGPQVALIPLEGRFVLLHYRRDVLQLQQLSPPETWEELVNMVALINGTDMDVNHRRSYSICLDMEGPEDAGLHLANIYSAHVQARGLADGLVWDPLTQMPLVWSAAMETALQIWKDLLPFSQCPKASFSSCPSAFSLFHEGRCGLLLSWKGPLPGPLPGPHSSAVRGLTGTTLSPGSTHILDRHLQLMTRCTPSLCPHAEPLSSTGGNGTRLVNRVVFVPLMSWSSSINAASTRLQQEGAYRFISYLGHPSSDGDELRGSRDSLGALRLSDVAKEALSAWSSNGADPQDADEYLAAMSSAASSKNIALDLRFPGAHLVRSWVLGEAAVNVSRGVPLAQVLEAQQEVLKASVQMLGMEEERFWVLYRQSLGISTQEEHRQLAELLAISLTGLVLLVLVGLVIWQVTRKRRRKLLRNWWGRPIPPGPGLDTSLVVVQIVDFPILKLSLDPEVLTNTLALTMEVLSRNLVQYHGCRSEGDLASGLTAAFHSPQDAFMFAMHMHTDLLHQNWDQKLVSCQASSTLYMKVISSPTTPLPTLLATENPTTPQDLTTFTGTTIKDMAHLELSSAGEKPQPASNKNSLKSRPPDLQVPTFTGAPSPSCQDSTHSLLEESKKSYMLCGINDPDAVLVAAGPRLMIGMHSGLNEDSVTSSPGRKLLKYTGDSLSCAVALCKASGGGMLVLMSEETFSRLSHEDSTKDHMVLHLGEHSLPHHELPVNIYGALPSRLRPRLGLVDPVQGGVPLVPGIFSAPLGLVTVVFVNVVGASTLMSWNGSIAHEVLTTFRTRATHLATPLRGYVAESVDGLVLAVFSRPVDGVMWALRTHQVLLSMDWPEELLSYELGEEVTVSTGLDSETGGEEGQELVLFRGPRLRTGMDLGSVTGDVNPLTGRMTYRGRVMNRAARISAAAPSGQVHCSAAVWGSSQSKPEVAASQVVATNLGYQDLKGVNEKIEVYWCRLGTDILRTSRRSSLAFSQPGLEATTPKGHGPSSWSFLHPISPKSPGSILRNQGAALRPLKSSLRDASFTATRMKSLTFRLPPSIETAE